MGTSPADDHQALGRPAWPAGFSAGPGIGADSWTHKVDMNDLVAEHRSLEHSPMATTELAPTDRHYGAKVAAVEPGGAEAIPLAERHGRPVQLLWTWTSPNLEFATVFVGVICVLFFGLSFWQSVLAITLGTGLGALSHGVLSSWGPNTGQCQMVLSRRGFGFLGNFLPAGLNSLTAGIGWFAVEQRQRWARARRTDQPQQVPLPGDRGRRHAVDRLLRSQPDPAVRAVRLPPAGGRLRDRRRRDPVEGAPGRSGRAGPWRLLDRAGRDVRLRGRLEPLRLGLHPVPQARFRPLRRHLRRGRVVRLVRAARDRGRGGRHGRGRRGLELDNPVASYTGLLPLWLEKLTLLAICLGAIAANALNVYSSALSFTAMGIKLPTKSSRAAMAIVMGTAGFLVAVIGIDNIGSYENFLLVIAYWIGPWLGVVFADRVLRRFRVGEMVTFDPKYRNWAGFVAMLVGAVVSIWLFSNQAQYVGMVPTALPEIGDITFEIGFLLAFGLYALLHRPLAGPITYHPAAESFEARH